MERVCSTARLKFTCVAPKLENKSLAVPCENLQRLLLLSQVVLDPSAPQRLFEEYQIQTPGRREANMDGRNDLEKGSQPRSDERVDLHADPNGATDESPSVNGQPLDESGQNRNKDSQFRFLNFIATQDGTHELSEISYKNSSDFSEALNSQDLQHVRFDPTDNCHQILVATVPGQYDFQEDFAGLFKTFESYLECRQAPKESQGFLRRFISREGTEVLIPLDDGQIERNFWTYWRRPSPTETKALAAATHYSDLYSIEAATPLSWRRDIFEPNEHNYVINYSLTQQVCCLCMPQTIILVHSEGYMDDWALPRPSDQGPLTGSVTQSLIAGLRGFDRQTVSTPEVFRFIQRSICQIMLDDEWDVLCRIDRVLRGFDRQMLQQVWIDNSRMQTWMLGHWRAYLHCRPDFNLQLTRIIKAATNPGEKAEQDLRLAHNRLDVRAEGTLRHFESTFSATIGSMSFIESTKAIQQAEQVKKLTQLAFCFIPLSFVCGIFGMNVNVSYLAEKLAQSLKKFRN